MTARRALLIGWSAADWPLLERFLEEGVLPNLKQFLEAGAHGRLRTLQPQFEPQLWTSMATGQRADVHGIIHGFSPMGANNVSAVSSRDRRCRSLWDMAAANDLTSAVINWPVTYPVPAVQGSLVSDVFFLLSRLEDKTLAPPAPHSAQPEALAHELTADRLSPTDLSHEEMSFFVSGLDHAQQDNDPMLTAVSIAVARTVNVHAAAMSALSKPGWHLGMVRYDLLAMLGPKFMACAEPQMSYVPDVQYKRYHQTIKAACCFLDLFLGALLDCCDEDTSIILVSERGMHSGEQRPPDAFTAFQQVGAAPWYREHGLLAARGPGIAAGGGVQGATLLDVAPTLLTLLGLPLAADMPGRVLREMIPEVQVAKPIGSYDRGRLPPGANTDWRTGQRKPALRNALEQGWIQELPEASEAFSEQSRREREFNLAMVALDARKPNRARKRLERLHAERPDEDRIALHLARCLRAAGDLPAAQSLLEKVVDHVDPRPYERMALARIQLANGEHDAALMNLFRAEQSEGQRPGVHASIGDVYLSMQRWEEAKRAFGKALERDSQYNSAQLGLASVYLGLEQWEDALEAALEAIDLDRNQPQGHYLLGVALAKQNNLPMAAEVFRTCLSLDGWHQGALKALAMVSSQLGDEAETQRCEDKLRQIDAAGQMQKSLREYRQQH